MIKDFSNKLHLIGQVIRRPSCWYAIIAWRPFSLTSFVICKKLQTVTGPITTIIDGGANVGQFARAASETFEQAKLYCFEPLPDIAQQCKNNLEDQFRVQVFPIALGSNEGTQQFFRNEYSQASSFLDLEPEATSNHALVSNKHESVTVDVTTLDKWAGGLDLQKPLLIKLDLQGYELEALKGATKTLSKADYVLVEAAIERTYKGEPGLNDLEQFLKENGFLRLADLNRVYSPDNDLLQVDALFSKGDTNVQ